MQGHNEALLGERRPRRRLSKARHDHDDRLHLGREKAAIPGVPTLDWSAGLFVDLADEGEPEPVQSGPFLAVPLWQDAVTVRSRFVEMAMMAEWQRTKGRDLLGTLLGSACCTMDRGCETLRPLWAEEAMHRAYNFLRLVDARNRANGLMNERATNIGMEDAFARDLVAQFRELEIRPDREVVPCSTVLLNVVTSFGALFCGPANIVPETWIDRVSLPAYKRRALVLAATELVTNALLHAFQGRRAGRIAVSLDRSGSGTASLRVADDGIGFIASRPNLHYGVASGLAELLESDLAYDRLDGWTIAKIAFPVDGL